MTCTEVFAGLAVTEYDAAVEWYERLAGRSPDLIPNDIEAAWQLTDTGWIYVVVDREQAGTGLVTLLVDDLDAWLAEVRDRGLEPGRTETIPGVVRTAEFLDPDGNRVTFGWPG